MHIINPNHKLGEASEDPGVDKKGFQKLVGKLIYLARTQLDISYAISVALVSYAIIVVSRSMHNSKEVHLHAANKILHYFKANLDNGIILKKNAGLIIKAYTNDDHVGPPIDRLQN